uniref:Uncharacterized protein n=1 Tax=Anguilla anguilla TaxID=7936 RepID=A0A0E9XZC5_ANGAN
MSSHSFPETTGMGQEVVHGLSHLVLWAMMAVSTFWILSRRLSRTFWRILMLDGNVVSMVSFTKACCPSRSLVYCPTTLVLSSLTRCLSLRAFERPST